MLPIGDDDVRGAGPSYVTYILVAINVVVFIYQISLGQGAVQDFINRWGAIPVEILQGNQLITLITSIFLHGGWLHLISNMLFLWVFGDNIEHTLGHFGFTVFYLVGGMAASLAHILINPESSVPSVGASGAIAAILGSYIVMFPRSRVRMLVFIGLVYVTQTSALFFLGIWFVLQLFSGVASIAETAQTGGVAFWAHIGGFIFGLIVGFAFRGRASELQITRR